MKNKTLTGNNENDKSNGISLKGSIALVGFEILDPAEQAVIKRIVGGYIKKMGNMGNYKEMKLTLQQHPHGKSFKHEINAMATFGEGTFNAAVTEWNVYAALAKICEKIMSELEHKKKKEQRHEKVVFKR